MRRRNKRKSFVATRQKNNLIQLSRKFQHAKSRRSFFRHGSATNENDETKKEDEIPESCAIFDNAFWALDASIRAATSTLLSIAPEVEDADVLIKATSEIETLVKNLNEAGICLKDMADLVRKTQQEDEEQLHHIQNFDNITIKIKKQSSLAKQVFLSSTSPEEKEEEHSIELASPPTLDETTHKEQAAEAEAQQQQQRRWSSSPLTLPDNDEEQRRSSYPPITAALATSSGPTRQRAMSKGSKASGSSGSLNGMTTLGGQQACSARHMSIESITTDDDDTERYEETHKVDRELFACCRGLPMISQQGPVRIAWDVLLFAELAFIVVIEPMDIGFWSVSMTRSHSFIGVCRIFIDVTFVLDLFLNFRTSVILDDGTELTEPRACALSYLKTWFTLDFVSSIPPVIELILAYAIASSNGGAGSRLSSAKLLKLGRVVKAFKILRLGKLAKFKNTNSSLSDWYEDFMASSSSVFMVRIGFIFAIAILLAHLLACFMAMSGSGWFRYYDPRGDSSEDPETWSWRRRYLICFYFSFSTMTTVGYGDVVPVTDFEREYAVLALIFGVGFYSYIIATVTSMVTSYDAKSAIYFDKMDQLSSWMRHYHFEASLRRKTRAFFKKFYDQRSAIDERSILENLTPQLQQDVSVYLLHDFVKDHPLFSALPEGALWKVLMITRTVSFEAGAIIAKRNEISFSLFIMCAGRGKAVYSIHDGPIVRKRTRRYLAEHGDEDVLESVDIGPGNSFGELCLLGTHGGRSFVTVTAKAPSEFFLIQRDAFLDAFSNLPEVLESMMNAAMIFAQKPVFQIDRNSAHLNIGSDTGDERARRRSNSSVLKERQASLGGPLTEEEIYTRIPTMYSLEEEDLSA